MLKSFFNLRGSSELWLCRLFHCFCLISGCGENVPGIPGACATLNFTYLARGPCSRKGLLIYCWCWLVTMSSVNWYKLRPTHALYTILKSNIHIDVQGKYTHLKSNIKMCTQLVYKQSIAPKSIRKDSRLYEKRNMNADEFVVTICTGSFSFYNFLCNKRWQNR